MARRPPPIDLGGIDKRKLGRDGAPGSATPGTAGPAGRAGGPGSKGDPGEPHWSATAPDPLVHPVWGHSVELVVYNWVDGNWVNLAAASSAADIAAHEAAPDPHPGYLREVDAATTYATISYVDDAIAGIDAGGASMPAVMARIFLGT